MYGCSCLAWWVEWCFQTVGHSLREEASSIGQSDDSPHLHRIVFSFLFVLAFLLFGYDRWRTLLYPLCIVHSSWCWWEETAIIASVLHGKGKEMRKQPLPTWIHIQQTAGTIKRVGVFHWINTRLVMEILLNLISSPLKLITISYMRYSLPRIVSLYHLLTACLLIVYWVLSREKEHDTAGIML